MGLLALPSEILGIALDYLRVPALVAICQVCSNFRGLIIPSWSDFGKK